MVEHYDLLSPEGVMHGMIHRTTLFDFRITIMVFCLGNNNAHVVVAQSNSSEQNSFHRDTSNTTQATSYGGYALQSMYFMS